MNRLLTKKAKTHTLRGMNLYHGSNTEIKEPQIIAPKRLLDFGAGFYLTSDEGQAKKWALRAKDRRGCGTACVSVFEAEQEQLVLLEVLSFGSTNKEWLQYICSNRTGCCSNDAYAVVMGPVANDQVIRTVNNYISGYLTEEIALELLQTQKLKDQYAFKTERALSALKFNGVEYL